ncbi:MAG: histidine triad protein [Alphaproteobacteria bacterium]|nr:MAG: histidine triad protein [Alphaproteobacteria bacterium]
MTGFELDGRLAGDTLMVRQLASGPLLLMNDRRWPWLMLVPAVAGAVELHELAPPTAAGVHAETDRIAAALKRATGCAKINVGALGNVVSQLHIHVVARNPGDANWPGPVWGVAGRQPWPAGAAARLIDAINHALDTGPGSA